MTMNGITSLIALSQLKQVNANEAALDGADKQRDLIKEMKDLRAGQRALEDKLRDKTVTQDEYWQISALLQDHGLDASNWDGEHDGMLGGHDAEHGQWAAKLGAEGQQATNQDLADAVKQQFDDAIKDLEAQDKLGNFEIQDLMSTFNQAQTLASNVQKKRDDTENAVIGKI